MKKISIIVMALAFLAALTQCKKEQVAPANDSEAVAITLDIKCGNGTRMDVNTATGEVTYESGDKIYVASGGKYVGTLTHNGTRFSGTITDPVVGEPLHFYFLGNVTPAETLTAGTTTTCSVVISDQTQHLPVIEYAPSNETYTAGATTFTAHLLNKCALVKFNVTTSSSVATCITGFNNKVTVDFSANTLIPSMEGNGVIILPAGNGEKWAILLPQSAMEAGVTGSAYSINGRYTGTHSAVPIITDNVFLTAGIDVTVTTKVNDPGGVPVGAIRGEFTINENGYQVYFSKGNLQYQASTNMWRFATNQYDYVGSGNNNISSTYSGWIDLFGWGTSGYNHGGNCYQPWSISTNDEDYFPYNYNGSNLYDQTGQADWGYNPISNGGYTENQWRTLTRAEWAYVFDTRSTTSGIRYAKANVNGVNGVILLPDDWDTSTCSLVGTNTPDASFSSNTFTAPQWSILELSGAVFLPAAGNRRGTSVSDVGSEGRYWTASFGEFAGGTTRCFDSYLGDGGNPRFWGCSVRLVKIEE